MDAPPAAILTDIEGTTTPIAFVRDVLFPYARARLPDVVARGADDAVVGPLLDEVRAAVPNRPVLDTLLAWMDADAKATPLKTLQGLIWAEGYRSGAICGRLYDDVAQTLRSWHAAGRRLYVYSSGSVAAQRLLFGHSDAGDLVPLFDAFFDTAIGQKRETGSYARISAACGIPPGRMLFLSDVEAELDAATEAGLRVCQLVRPEDGTVASARHEWASDFGSIVDCEVGSRSKGEN